MLDLSTLAVTEWLHRHQPEINEPSVNQAEKLVEPYIIKLGNILEAAMQANPHRLATCLEDKELRLALCKVLAKIGPARQLRILAWLAESKLPNKKSPLDQILDESDGLLRKTILAVHRKTIISQLFKSDRVAKLILACRKASITAMLALFISQHALAETSTNTGCAALAQAASDGMAATIKADDQTIKQPQSVTKLTCLSNFFNGLGLNVITNILDPGNLLQAVEGKICAVAQQAWQDAVGATQCGLTVTGFNLGFGLGGGTFCPRLSIGGGGTPLTSVGISATNNGSGGLYLNGVTQPPTGYTVPTTPIDGLQ